jgi:hypothetical protein
MSSWGFINDFNSFLGFLGLGLGFEQDEPCICMYLSNIIRNFILYICFMYKYIFHIIFCVVLST